MAQGDSAQEEQAMAENTRPKRRARKKVRTADDPDVLDLADLGDKIVTIHGLGEEIKELTQGRDVLREDVLTQLQAARMKSMTHVTDDDVKYTATVVAPTRVIVNPDKLKKAIGAEAFKKITKPVMVEALLEDAIAQGTIDMNIVAQCSDEVPSKPYIKITEKK